MTPFAEMLIDLTVRGSLAALGVMLLDAAYGRGMRSGWRRLWWVLVPLVFLVPFRIPILPAFVHPIFSTSAAAGSNLAVSPDGMSGLASVDHPIMSWRSYVVGVWLAGVVGSAIVVIVQTCRVTLRWSRLRLSTDARLLELLENAKKDAGVTAPIGLVVSSAVSTPALLGWLRPRILLPQAMAESGNEVHLQAIFLHELAHFHSLDIPLGWLFSVAAACHWFNPVIYLAARSWKRFREEAADESAVRAMRDPSGRGYGEALVFAVGHGAGGRSPYGALAIGESFETLKRRVIMTKKHMSKRYRHWLGALVCCGLLLLAVGQTARAGDNDNVTTAKLAATAAMQTWLQEIDSGNYAESWREAGAKFQEAVTSKQWAATVGQVRKKVGQCLNRHLASVSYHTRIPDGQGGALMGEFVIAQFDSSFANLDSAVEVVTFGKAADGTWKALGYWVKPKG